MPQEPSRAAARGPSSGSAPHGPGEPLHGVSGRVSGVLTLVLVVLLLLMSVLSDDVEFADWLYAGLALVAVLAWGSMLRPGVLLTPEHVVLRGMFDTVRVPLLAVRSVEVRAMLEVRTAAKRFTSPAIGRSRRRQRGPGMLGRVLGKGAQVEGSSAEVAHSDFVEQRIRARVADSRAQAGLPDRPTDDEPSPPPAERTLAWPEIVVAALALAALVVTLVV